MKVGWRRRMARGGEESPKTGGCRAGRERRTGDPAGKKKARRGSERGGGR
jgi:hypothetical protein